MSTIDLHNHPHFQAWKDPVSGVTSHVLRPVAAPLQRALYFVVPSIRGNGQWLWFHGFHPPVDCPQLACVSLDPQAPDIHTFPNAMSNGNPLIDPAGDSIHVPIGDGIYHLHLDGHTTNTFRMPREVLDSKHLFLLCTELTESCDGRYYLLDSEIGNRWLISLVEKETGKHLPLRWFGNRHHHAIFSKHDPELFLINQGHWTDRITGDKNAMNVRTWLMNTRLDRYEPLDPNLWFGQNSHCCHEWWTPSGKVQWCDYQEGIWEMDLETREKQLLWNHPLVHGQSDAAERYLVGDQNPYNWNDQKPCSVWFFDRASQREIPIVSHMPPHPLPWRDFRTYHIDPHPNFSDDGQWVIYTTTAFGSVTLALCSVADLLKQLG